MKQNLIFILILLLCNYGIAIAECPPGSGLPENGCPAGKKYPYKVCVDGQITIECLSDPNSRNGIIKYNLPISFDPHNHARMTHRIGQSQLLCPNEFYADLENASNAWNCICGHYVNSDPYSDNYGSENSEEARTLVAVKISNDPENFKNATSDPSDTPTTSNTSGNDNCYPSEPTIFLNSTSNFRNAGNFLMNDNLIDDNANYVGAIRALEGLSTVPDEYKIYSFLEATMQQIGGMLGMGWSEDCDDKDENSIMAPLEPINVEPVIGGGDLVPAPRPRKKLTDYDKCMFAALYCSESSIDEYNPHFPKVYSYPNPVGDDLVTVVFDLPRTDNLKMTVKNVLGKTLLIPIENKLYEAGEYSLQINVNALPSGVYYIMIEAGLQTTAQPLIIAR